MPGVPWYRKYDEYRAEVDGLRDQFDDRYRALGVDAELVVAEVYQDIVARIVRESNWQEGLYLGTADTRALTNAVFDELGGIAGPHIDLDDLADIHRRSVLKMKRRGASVEELAAHNLSAAHVALTWIADELSFRQAATLVNALKQFRRVFPELETRIPKGERRKIEKGFELIEQLVASKAPPYAPLTGEAASEGVLLAQLEDVPFEYLLSPMRMSYIHFLHRIAMMGILPPGKCGVLRKTAVYVGRPDLYFPPPSALASLMEEFCSGFPTILPTVVKYDAIMKAAEVSHRFVRRHPYGDGNGRVSRLLMNLVLYRRYQPVYLKADKKGRHRYAQALRRADAGNIEPLACLIAISLKSVYGRLLSAVV